jgi:hypothetical protein
MQFIGRVKGRIMKRIAIFREGVRVILSKCWRREAILREALLQPGDGAADVNSELYNSRGATGRCRYCG